MFSRFELFRRIFSFYSDEETWKNRLKYASDENELLQTFAFLPRLGCFDIGYPLPLHLILLSFHYEGRESLCQIKEANSCLEHPLFKHTIDMRRKKAAVVRHDSHYETDAHLEWNGLEEVQKARDADQYASRTI